MNRRSYVMRRSEIQPQVFWRITDNWIELTVRCVAFDYAVREIKNAISRDILQQFDKNRPADRGFVRALGIVIGIAMPLIVRFHKEEGREQE